MFKAGLFLGAIALAHAVPSFATSAPYMPPYSRATIEAAKVLAVEPIARGRSIEFLLGGGGSLSQFSGYNPTLGGEWGGDAQNYRGAGFQLEARFRLTPSAFDSRFFGIDWFGSISKSSLKSIQNTFYEADLTSNAIGMDFAFGPAFIGSQMSWQTIEADDGVSDPFDGEYAYADPVVIGYRAGIQMDRLLAERPKSLRFTMGVLVEPTRVAKDTRTGFSAFMTASMDLVSLFSKSPSND